MPANEKTSKLAKDSILTIVLAGILVVAYLLILMYTFNNLTQAAENEILKSTSNASISIAKIINADNSQLGVIADELTQKYKELNPNRALDLDAVKGEMMDFLKKSQPEDSVQLGFYFSDSTYMTSLGETGEIDDYKAFEKNFSNSEMFSTDIQNEKFENCVHFYREIKNLNGISFGYIVSTYKYDETLSSCYDTAEKINGLHNVMFTGNGSIVLNTDVKGSDFESVSNLYDYLKKKQYNGHLPSVDDPQGSASINSFYTDVSKNIIAIAPVSEIGNLYIARIMPTSAMLAATGKLIVFMTLASFLFFFILIVVGYRYYKSLTETSNRIKNIAYTDPLTGYANYAKFKEDCEDILSTETDKTFYMTCADMVGFRYINDAFGYETGDEILLKIAQEMDSLLRDDEIFARISGDKFVILTERNFANTEDEPFVYLLADRISSIGPLAKSHIRIEVQMGIYRILPEDLENLSVNALYDRSLVALYSIGHTDSSAAEYDASIYDEQIERKDIESRMHQALKDGEFRVYVQPKYRTSNAKLAAGEALIRWIDPNKGIVPPIKFIPLFEQNRFVHDVDLYVMEVIARFQRMRLNEGLPVVPISLNISPVEFTMPGFRQSYISIKDKYDIPDRLIELEFTEGIFFDDEELFKDVIREFHEHGFSCSMDDFGSGYSSLNILKDLPVDVLKLDKLFFRESENTSRDRSIIRSVVAMARSLNIKTVAEGVETLDVVEFLKLIGCTLIQGYIYSKPLPLTEFEEKLNTENIDTDDEFEFDFDKFEVVPLEMPLSSSFDDSLRKTYAGIIEINAGGNIYHMYYPGERDVQFDVIPERGFYTSFYEDFIPKYVHPKDVEKCKKALNVMALTKHFKTNTDLNLEYRHMRKNGSYSWMKLHIIKATGGREDSQIFFGYFNIIDDYKETEENLTAAQSRFAAAYSNINGVVFELNLENGLIDILETHSSLLKSVKDVNDYNQLYGFICELLLHPDYKELVETKCRLDKVQEYFNSETNTGTLKIEVQAKPSRKVSRYNFYSATYSQQADKNKILLIVEDITESKVLAGASNLRHCITDIAFANTFDSICAINLEKDIYTLAVYPSTGKRKANVTEGRYSINFAQRLTDMVKDEDINTVSTITSLEGLKNFYEDTSTSEFRYIFQERESKDSDEYHWKEALLVSTPEEYGQDKQVYIFTRNIDEIRETEKSLNEYAHRLSYALAMFDYAYTVD
ncbi:MAG: EAL domain-containing protein, partial [Clostridia bacterium]|nr:EAL domain-containing protein [Clostridia bacterium]